MPLAAHAYVGLSTRYMADDYCQAAAGGRGVWATQVSLYLTWQGAVASNLFASLAGRLPPEAVRFWPAVALSAWVVLLTRTIWCCLSPVPRRERWLVALALATTLVALTLDGRPQMAPQVVYWLNGSLRYLGPQLFLVGYVAYVLHARRPGRPAPGPGAWVVAGGLAGAAALFSEVHTAAQVTGLSLATVACAAALTPARRRHTIPLLVAGAASSMMALVVMVLSPGMRVRQGQFPDPPGLVTVVLRALTYTADFLTDLVTRAPETLVIAIVVPAVLARLGGVRTAGAPAARLEPAEIAPWLIGVPIGCVVVQIACFATAAWAVSVFPPERTLLVPRSILFASLLTWGYLGGRWLAARGEDTRSGSARRLGLPGAVVLAVVSIWPLGEGLRALEVRGAADAYARTWDAFDRELTKAAANGLDAVRLPAPENVAGLDLVGPDRVFWVNGCVARYYGVAVTGFPPPAMPTAADRAGLTPVDVDLGGVARVTGYALHHVYATAGEPVDLAVEWLPEAATDQPHAVYLALHDPEDRPIAQQFVDLDPSGYTTSTWAAGRPFLGRYRLEIPLGIGPRSDARVVVGLSPGSTADRLSPRDAGNGSLATIRVSGSGCGPREEGRDAAQRQRDAMLLTELSTSFAGDALVRERRFELAVYDGAATLCSDDTDASVRERAMALAAQVVGVREVVDRMR